jgi:DNA-binding ferritin-like protein (Dps family)
LRLHRGGGNSRGENGADDDAELGSWKAGRNRLGCGDEIEEEAAKRSHQFISMMGNAHREDAMSILGSIMSAIFGTKAQAGELPTGAGSDVAAILDKMAAENPEKLDWKNSIVDLMKLVKLDSSLGARKQLAKDLNYTGNTNDSAAMNIWLHQQVMQKLAANGGKVPADLLKH